jgi:ammonium transporter, Amt family
MSSAQLDQLATDVDQGWILYAGSLVMFMHCGFTMLECGCVRTKNASNIIFKTSMDILLAAVTFWAWGYAFAYGGDNTVNGSDNANGFIGHTEFALASGGPTSDVVFSFWFIQWAFASTSATIVSGAVAERINPWAYCLFSTIISSFIYSVVVHWCWSANGWISPFNPNKRFGTNGFLDFAGSGVVHLVGGTCSVAAIAILGARRGRFGPRGEALHMVVEREWAFRPHNRVLASLGTLILWFGWYGFNGGSTFKISGGASLISARVATNTTLGGAAAGLSAFTCAWFILGHADIDALLNGLLAGLVSLTSGCAFVDPWHSLVIGLIGGVIYFFFARFIVWLRLDDPLQASAVHGSCGAWGCFATGLFCTEGNLLRVTGGTSKWGLFYGGGWEQIGVQCVGIICIIAWSAAISALVLIPLRLLNWLRVSAQQEDEGLDASFHGGAAYGDGGERGALDKAPSYDAGNPGAYPFMPEAFSPYPEGFSPYTPYGY